MLPNTLRPLALGLTLALSGTGVWAEPADSETPTTETEPSSTAGLLPLEDLRTFTKVYEHIRKGYVEEIDDATLLEYAIKGMLAELDPHSSYLNASSFDDLQVNTTGEFGGLGIEVGMENGFVKVISPIDDTPAAKAGIEAGDLIIELDKKPVKGLNLGEAIEMMRGPIDSEIKLRIVREGVEQPFEVVIVRDTIKVQSVRSRIIDDEYGYLRIAQFQVNTGTDTAKEVEEMLTENSDLKGLIIDLRNNPGGVLQASVGVAGTFLDGGLVVYTEGRVDNTDTQYNAQPGDLTNGLPIVVLINDGSASASEIVAGALQDHRRAVILGTESFGKGSVQTVIPLNEEQAIKLTTALYFTPNGRSIQAQGISPDIVVSPGTFTPAKSSGFYKEADLEGHLENSKEADNTSKTDEKKDEIQRVLAKDYQLQQALIMLKGMKVLTVNNPTTAVPANNAPAKNEVITEPAGS